MSVMYRSLALLAFIFLVAQNGFAQSRVVGSEAEIRLAPVMEITGITLEEEPVIPVVHAFQNPGERTIHVHADQLVGGHEVNIILTGPNGRLVRATRGYVCTMCGTFDIDLEEEIGQGRHGVIVEINGFQIVRTVWVE
ncbi:MAG: hypothetical protein AAGN35_03415 [Bacteroidota bacterium]